MKLPICVPEAFRIVAHRGASALAPENTRAAFALAEQLSVREVELDVQYSRDEQLVICHDAVLDRYGHPGKAIANLTLDELQSLDMGSWFSNDEAFANERMLTLSELFTCFGSRFVYHVEIKVPAPGIEKAVLKAIQEHHLNRSVIVSSFFTCSLEAMKRLAPSLPTAWLIRENGLSPENIAQARALGCQHICPRASAITSEQVSFAHKSIDEVRAFGVKTPEDACRVVKTGCDGLTVDDPRWLRNMSCTASADAAG